MTRETRYLGKILLYMHGSESSIIAAKLAIALAKKYDCLLTAIYVVNDNLLAELLGEKILVPAEKLAEPKGLAVETKLMKGVVHSMVAEEVKRGRYDLLIQGELGEVLSLRDALYEEGERILREVSCPVLVARGKEKVEKMYYEA